eukprot:XP_001612233.1 hypothetical protein [Babesia bovis T2Bo]
MKTNIAWQDRLVGLKSIYPANVESDEDAKAYIRHLASSEEKVHDILSSTVSDQLLADLIHLLEFEKDVQFDYERGNESLLYRVISTTLSIHCIAGMKIITRLYLRGFLKNIVICIILYYRSNFSDDTTLDAAWNGGQLEESSATLRICSSVLSVMSNNLARYGKNIGFVDRTDYYISRQVVILLLKSLLVASNSTYEPIFQLFHFRSASRVSIKMQLFILDVVKWINKKRTIPLDPGLQEFSCLGLVKYILQQLCLLWTEKLPSVDNRTIVSIAAAIIKSMDIIYSNGEELVHSDFEHTEIYITQGINNKLGQLDVVVSKTAMYLAHHLSKWSQRRDSMLGNTKQETLDIDLDQFVDEPAVWLPVATTDVLEELNPATAGITETHSVNQGETTAETCPSVSIPDTNQMTANTNCKTSGHQIDPLVPSNDNSKALIDAIFADVPVVQLEAAPPVSIDLWTDPPQHIQQCYERLTGTPVVSDVEVGKLLNKPLNKPRDMPTDASRRMIAQTLFYLPSVIDRNEAILDRFAVSVCEYVSRMDNLNLYEDSIISLMHSSMHSHESLSMWVQMFSHSGVSTPVNTQAHIALIIKSLVVKRPERVIEYICSTIPDTEYSLYQKMVLLTCLQSGCLSLSGVNEAHLGTSVVTHLTRVSSVMDTVSGKYTVPATPICNKPLRITPKAATSACSISLLSDQLNSAEIQERSPVIPQKQNVLIEEVDTAGMEDNNVSAQAVISIPSPSVVTCRRQSQSIAAPIGANNHFAAVANMAISWLLDAIHKCILAEQDLKDAATPLLVLCMLDTLCLMFQCSGGRVSPAVISSARELLSEVYNTLPSADISAMLVRLCKIMEDCHSGNMGIMDMSADLAIQEL